MTHYDIRLQTIDLLTKTTTPCQKMTTVAQKKAGKQGKIKNIGKKKKKKTASNPENILVARK